MPAIVHFDLPADDPARAKTFYSELFGWKIEGVFGMDDYFLIQTTGLDGSGGIGGGLGKRGSPDQHITNYIGVLSVDEYCARVENLGGTVVLAKTAVPGWGFLAVCTDTEGNTFGLWEENPASA
ncbi:MAG: VOC family protein [Methanomicrobiaceae archaeon]|nr:VOC family protein [Methanomicrobiaceae archaeon]